MNRETSERPYKLRGLGGRGGGAINRLAHFLEALDVLGMTRGDGGSERLDHEVCFIISESQV